MSSGVIVYLFLFRGVKSQKDGHGPPAIRGHFDFERNLCCLCCTIRGGTTTIFVWIFLSTSILSHLCPAGWKHCRCCCRCGKTSQWRDIITAAPAARICWPVRFCAAEFWYLVKVTHLKKESKWTISFKQTQTQLQTEACWKKKSLPFWAPISAVMTAWSSKIHRKCLHIFIWMA